MGKVVKLRRPKGVLHFEPEDVVGVFGKRGTGKSNFAKRELGHAWDAHRRVLVFDPHDEYSRHGHQTEEVTLGPLDDRCTLDELLLKPELLDAERLQLAVVPAEEPEECAADFERLCTMVRHTGDLLLCVEEVGYFEEHCRGKLNFLATQSRHWGVTVLFVAQRAVQVPKTARTQITQLVSFRQDNPDDLRALADLAGEDFAARVARLGRGESEQWRDSIPSARSASKKEKRA